MLSLIDILSYGAKTGASDIHITVGKPIIYRINGELTSNSEYILKQDDTKLLVYDILDKSQIKELEDKGEIDLSYSNIQAGRFRINAYKQRGNYSMALRIIPFKIPSPKSLGLPSITEEIIRLKRGMVLVTGPTGSGKSTTLASIINQININRSCHILTLEDPIEFFYEHKKSIVNQREIGKDSKSFSSALRAALRQDPDVILLGEMRDLETISIALTAAETGHLVISTLHTIGAAKTIDRIIDVFPSNQQQQIRVQLSMVIQVIISQQLLPNIKKDNRVAAFETMVATPAIRNLIRDNKIYQIDNSIQTGSKFGMKTMDSSIIDLLKRGLITKDTAINQAINLNQIEKYI